MKTRAKRVKVAGQWLTIGHYKEPMRAVPASEGYGYYGALLMTKGGAKVQCHVCGGLFDYLAAHLRKHKLNVGGYRTRFNLAKSTSLISEAQRIKMAKAYGKRMESMTPKERARWRAKGLEKLLAWRRKNRHYKWELSLESKNERGSCPDQVLEYIRKLANKYHRTPTYKEVGQRYGALAFKVFGSYNNALRQLGIKPRQRGVQLANTNRFKEYTTQELIDAMKQFYKAQKRPPTFGDFSSDGVRSGRGYLPRYSLYRARFGGITKARKAAGVPEPKYN